MLSFLRPIMENQVKHWFAPTRDVFGNETRAGFTTHPARVVESDGRLVSLRSGNNLPDAKAIIYLLNHTRPVAVGDTFELPSGRELKVIAAERGTAGPDTLIRAYLT